MLPLTAPTVRGRRMADGGLRPPEPTVEPMASKGDPRVHFVMNVILSAAFVYVALVGLDFVGAAEFTLQTYLIATAVLVVLTHVLVR